VNVVGNKTADKLAKESNLRETIRDRCLTFLEIASHVKLQVNSLWSVAPRHMWYECNRPGATLTEASSRGIEMARARLHSGHLRVQCHVSGLKVFPTCPK